MDLDTNSSDQKRCRESLKGYQIREEQLKVLAGKERNTRVSIPEYSRCRTGREVQRLPGGWGV